jgi:hypothetical protein
MKPWPVSLRGIWLCQKRDARKKALSEVGPMLVQRACLKRKGKEMYEKPVWSMITPSHPNQVDKKRQNHSDS